MSYIPNTLVPELSITDLGNTLKFYVDVLGFKIENMRKEEGFAFLSLGTAQMMFDQINLGRTWKTGDLDYPLGRGINFEIQVENIDEMLKKLKEANIELFLELEEKWYRKGDIECGNKQFLVQDPDGYLLRFFEDIGDRKFNFETIQ